MPQSWASTSTTCWCRSRDTGEQALEIADMLVRSGAIDVVVVDSVAALDAQGRNRGRDGRLARRPAGAPDVARRCASSPATSSARTPWSIFINQIRMKIGVMFGNPETTTGGNALKFYASVRLDIRRTGALKNGEEVIGNADTRQGGQEQGRAAVPRGRVRDHLRRRHFCTRARSIDLGVESEVWSRSRDLGTLQTGERIGRQGQMPQLPQRHPATVGANSSGRFASAVLTPRRWLRRCCRASEETVEHELRRWVARRISSAAPARRDPRAAKLARGESYCD
jgi:recombination protein RecA